VHTLQRRIASRRGGANEQPPVARVTDPARTDELRPTGKPQQVRGPGLVQQQLVACRQAEHDPKRQGLVVGKPAGILLLCWLALASGLCRLPSGVGWRHVAGAGLLGGVGFTMSIFVATLAFAGDPGLVNSSKMAVLLASLVAGAGGYAWLRVRIGK